MGALQLSTLFLFQFKWCTLSVMVRWHFSTNIDCLSCHSGSPMIPGPQFWQQMHIGEWNRNVKPTGRVATMQWWCAIKFTLNTSQLVISPMAVNSDFDDHTSNLRNFYFILRKSTSLSVKQNIWYFEEECQLKGAKIRPSSIASVASFFLKWNPFDFK